MRLAIMKRYFVSFAVAVTTLWMIAQFVTTRNSGISSAPREVRDREKLKEKLDQLNKMADENKQFLDKLKQDIMDHRAILMSKIRSEISAQQHVTKMPRETSLSQEKGNGVEDKHVDMPIQISNAHNRKFVIPIVITACNRPSVSRCLNKLFEVRGTNVEEFPIIVSQDCGDQATADVLRGYGDKITFFQHSPEPVPAGVKKHLVGYYKIASHYKFAISESFKRFPSADSIVILEDDIEVSPDFLSYFAAMHELLLQDDSLWCASAWNDNGKTNLIDTSEKGAEILYRTDFFPGLGWLLKRSLWEEELSSKWPASFWDDWMRESAQRKGRSCIRPEISRTSTFGRKGVSAGQFFDTHLKYIKLNEYPVDWSTKDVSFLKKENYDRSLRQKVYSLPIYRLSELKDNKDPDVRELRIEYSMASTFKAFAKDLGLMVDFKAGVPRTAYLGIVTVMYRGRRVYLAPPENWTGYDEKWT